MYAIATPKMRPNTAAGHVMGSEGVRAGSACMKLSSNQLVWSKSTAREWIVHRLTGAGVGDDSMRQGLAWRGNSTVKVAPTPGALRTLTLPPSASTI